MAYTVMDRFGRRTKFGVIKTKLRRPVETGDGPKKRYIIKRRRTEINRNTREIVDEFDVSKIYFNIENVCSG